MKNDWQAESDAHTLVEAQTIKNDKKRTAAAKKAAAKMIKDQEARTKSLRSVAKPKAKKKKKG